MASKGQLVINSIDHAVGGTIDFTLTGLELRHVDGAVTNPDGCATAITSVHVTATLVPE